MALSRFLPGSVPKDAPGYRLKVGKAGKVDDAITVLSIVVVKEVNRIPYARVELLDGTVDQEDFPLSNTKDFVPGQDMEIELGYQGSYDSVFKGVIVKHGIQIRGTGVPVLCLELRDPAVKMTINRKFEVFANVKDSKLMKDIIGKYTGVSAKVAATTTEHSQMVQYDSTDWDFVLTRAEKNGMVVTVEDGEVTVGEPKDKEPASLELQWGTTLYEFDSEIDARYQYESVTSQGWDFSEGKLTSATNANPGVGLTGPGNLKSSELTDVIGAGDISQRHSGFLLDGELSDWSKGQMVKSRLARVRGRARCQGIHSIKPNMVLDVGGVGDRFKGTAWVSGVRHTMHGSNWETDVQFGMCPEWFTTSAEISQLPAGGLLPAISGLQIGIVDSLEDEGSEFRVLVKLPMVGLEAEGVWARVAALDAGEGRGSYFRPEKGDEVILGFVNDDPRNAVVLGMLHSKKRPASDDFEPSNDNHVKGLVTRGGTKIIFNDEDDNRSIYMEVAEDNKLTISEADKGFTFEDVNGNKILMNADGITLDSAAALTLTASDTVTISGANIAQNADEDWSAEGGLTLNIKSVTTDIKGDTVVKINT